MSSFDFAALLDRWSAGRAEPVVQKTPRADAGETFKARFGISPPSDLAAFLRITDGLEISGGHPVTFLRGVNSIAPLAKESPESVKAWGRFPASRLSDGAYFSYATTTSQDYRPAHLRHTLLLSGGEATNEGDAEIVLNPQVVWPDQSWEVWVVAHWLPGVARYRDFKDFLLYLASKDIDVAPFRTARRSDLSEAPPMVFTGTLGSSRRKGKLAEVPDADSLLKAATTGKFRERQRAIKAMAGSGDERVGQYLIDTLRSDPDERVRNNAVRAMQPRGDARAIDALREAFENKAANQNDIAAALANVSDERALAVLRTAAASDDPILFSTGAFPLMERRDPWMRRRALEVACDPPVDEAAFSYSNSKVAWTLLGMINEDVADELIGGLQHGNANVRLMAALSIPQSRLRDTHIQHQILAVLDKLAQSGSQSMSLTAAHHAEHKRRQFETLNTSASK